MAEAKTKKTYNFNEKNQEYDSTTKKKIPVYQSPKYIESKNKVTQILNDNKYGLVESDFWILMNKTTNGEQMAYTGLIISHNGCLKINDALDEKMKFKPSCVRENKEGYEESLVYSYCNDEQGIYEVGEISPSNYKQSRGRYPYAMAYKRLFDRVVLKNSKLAYAGVMSDSEADEFKEKIEESVLDKVEDKTTSKEEKTRIAKLIKEFDKYALMGNLNVPAFLKKYGVESTFDLTEEQLTDAIKKMVEKLNIKEKSVF